MTIKWYAFLDCTSLESITIPNRITEIGNSAFGYYEDYDNREIKYYKFSNFHINCYPDTAGEQYAIYNGFDYKLLKNTNIDYANVTCDGSVDMLDVLLIRKYIAKQPVHLGPQA